MAILYKYKIFCETDGHFEFTDYRDSSLPAPTTCPINTSHTCTAGSVAIEQTLDTSVQPVEVQKLPDPPPFAVPSYRTKWDASSDIQEVIEDSTADVDLLLTEERYCHGGEIIFEGAQLGDWIEASIYDDNGVIPQAYRAAVCENWPLVANYIKRYNLRSGSGARELNTYPLNAKITMGLILRVRIHTCSIPGTRKIGTNYFLTKKL